MGRRLKGNTGYAVDMDAVKKDVKMEMGRRGVRFQEEEREWRLPGLLYADHLVLCGELQEDLRAMVGHFVEVRRRRGLKVIGGKSKGIIMNEEEGLECEVYVDGVCLEHVFEFKYLECVLDEAECSRKVVSGRRVTSVIRSFANARDLQIECTRVLHETLVIPVLMYGNETML